MIALALRVGRRRFCLFAVVALTSALSGAHALASETDAERHLVQSLQHGGYNIYFRHAQTDWSQSDRVRAVGDWNSCDPTQIRQLSAQGRETARRIGRAMRRLAIPVGQLLASPYCRCRETAELLGFGTPDITTDVMNMRVARFFGGPSAIVASARIRLATAPAPATNTVIVAHGNVARDATPVYPGEAEAVVFEPLGSGEFRVVARITPARWFELAARYTAQ